MAPRFASSSPRAFGPGELERRRVAIGGDGLRELEHCGDAFAQALRQAHRRPQPAERRQQERQQQHPADLAPAVADAGNRQRHPHIRTVLPVRCSVAR